MLHKSFTLSILLITSTGWAQHITGVFAGEFIAGNNALVLKQKGNIVTGDLHLNHDEKLLFVGIVQEDFFYGDLAIGKGQVKQLIGAVISDSLYMKLVSYADTSDVDNFVMFRLSSKPKYDLNKIFGKEVWGRDLRLVGTWEQVKFIKPDGQEQASSFFHTIEFKKHGEYIFEDEAYKKLMTQFQSAGIVPPQFTWLTKGSALKVTASVQKYNFANDLIYQYQLQEDTLVLTSKINGSATYYSRKTN